MGTAYIAGKISGNKRYKEQFSAAARFLRSCGFETVLNPAAMIPDTADPATAMRICLSAIDVADAVFFLPNWRDSTGARLEHSYCEYIDKEIEYLQTRSVLDQFYETRQSKMGGAPSNHRVRMMHERGFTYYEFGI